MDTILKSSDSTERKKERLLHLPTILAWSNIAACGVKSCVHMEIMQ
jgi:hypothetical protein